MSLGLKWICLGEAHLGSVLRSADHFHHLDGRPLHYRRRPRLPRCEADGETFDPVSMLAAAPWSQIAGPATARCDAPYPVMPLIQQPLFFDISSGGRALSGEASLPSSPSVEAVALKYRMSARFLGLK